MSTISTVSGHGDTPGSSECAWPWETVQRESYSVANVAANTLFCLFQQRTKFNDENVTIPNCKILVFQIKVNTRDYTLIGLSFYRPYLMEGLSLLSQKCKFCGGFQQKPQFLSGNRHFVKTTLKTAFCENHTENCGFFFCFYFLKTTLKTAVYIKNCGFQLKTVVSGKNHISVWAFKETTWKLWFSEKPRILVENCISIWAFKETTLKKWKTTCLRR